MFYSINFGNSAGTFNTWEEWMLIPTSRPLVSVPEAKIKTVDIPGGHGRLDLTDILGGSVRYGMRTGSWEFAVANPNVSISGLTDYVDAGRKFSERKWKHDIDVPFEDERSWIMVYSDIMSKLHGKKTLVNLTDDPDYSYWGRVKVNEWRSEEKYSVIVIDYELNPFKFQNGADPEKASISTDEGGVL